MLGPDSLTDQVVVITGSSSGIGAALAHEFAAHGASVLVNSARSVDAGQAVAASLGDGHYVQASIAEPGGPQAIVDAALDRWGRIDVLVNNAGTTRTIPHHDLDAASIDIWREIYETNVFGTWEMCRLAAPHLRAQHGSIISITSLAGLRPTGSSIPYATSKVALNHLTALLAATLGPDVRVNAIAPGLVDTPWTEDWDTVRAYVQSVAPLKRSATPGDIVDIALMLATNQYVTGVVVPVDGGLSLR